jgi:pimeloyl-ACP methyl ester carboxylesterase
MKFARLKAAVALAALIVPTFASAEPRSPIVLVHGAWETSAVWQEVAVILTRDGYKTINVDLPGRPGNPAAPNEVSLELYQKTVAEAVARASVPVVLVGHSFGGFIISAEAEAEPKRVKTLVFVAAYIPQDGQSLFSLATTDKGSKVGPALHLDKATGYASIAYASRASLFANDAPASVGKFVADGVVDEPLPPLVTPVRLSPSRFGTVDKVYIETLRDNVISPGFQLMMVKNTPVRLLLSIDTGHTPFITQPQLLAWDIEKAAQ